MNSLNFLTARSRVQRAAKVLKRTLALVRRRLKAADVWVQDHHVGVGVTVLVLITTASGLLLRFRLDQMIWLARQFAPVFTILSITITAVLGSIKWVRKRRQARLATTDTTGF
ncbi:hypothetical protein ACFU6I_48415 [Streptomyces sp. NPDC057486]|uniref:hypothetical protein n=1 Tax=Streptomyces sp. NPDC057486 TaxID=3346145 RepID=UPI0036C3CBB7